MSRSAFSDALTMGQGVGCFIVGLGTAVLSLLGEDPLFYGAAAAGYGAVIGVVAFAHWGRR